MILQPNERKLVKKENQRVKEYVWNRTDYPLTVYYTSKGIEINSVDIRSIFMKPEPKRLQSSASEPIGEKE